MTTEYLDVAPMIRALGEEPGAFEMSHHYIHHKPSRHWLAFEDDGSARVFARCDCAELSISDEQSGALRAAVAVWQEAYWRPLMAREAARRRVDEINRQFARHFRQRSRLRWTVDALQSFFGIGGRGWPYRIDPSLPEDAELRAGSRVVASKQNENDAISV